MFVKLFLLGLLSVAGSSSWQSGFGLSLGSMVASTFQSGVNNKQHSLGRCGSRNVPSESKLMMAGDDVEVSGPGGRKYDFFLFLSNVFFFLK